MNLGWSGGLHRARALTDAELLVWVQDDMVPEPGWLDALVDAADAHRSGGGVRLGPRRRARPGDPLQRGGREPGRRVGAWSDTDTTAEWLPAEVTAYDWVTSKGFLTRAPAFDEVGGPDPRLWPLNHVDKDYCTHLRCHGYDVALVPGARLRHAGSQSAPTPFRAFLARLARAVVQPPLGRAVAAPAGRSSVLVDHPCADWQGSSADAARTVVGAEASRMLVPFIRRRARRRRADCTRCRRVSGTRPTEALADATAQREPEQVALADAAEAAGPGPAPRPGSGRLRGPGGGRAVRCGRRPED